MLGGTTSLEAACERIDATPFWEDVHAIYSPTNERLQERNYRIDLRQIIENVSVNRTSCTRLRYSLLRAINERRIPYLYNLVTSDLR